MNREIKFRAWDVYAKRMEQINCLYRFENEGIHGTSCHDLPDGKVWALMQYTGLKDKNGVDIYEKDIIKHDYGFGNGKGVVEYLALNFTLSWGDSV